MIKPLAALAGAAALSLTFVVPATAATTAQAGTTATTSTTVCGSTGLQAGRNTKLCAERNGDQVRLYGVVSLAGPVSPGTPWPPSQQLFTVITGTSPSGTLYGTPVYNASTITVGDVTGTVACDVPVQGTFSVESYGLPPHPVSLNAVVPC
ncbi:hypothetical protein ACIQBJ_31590 [Kitasatospora sp. NPDC088391]|uniref:hypothetical protein n=1 Tax=Kitasatospora sp. NPDC088391 TaxID=3364074 RepID=UPI0037F6AB81